MKTQKGITLVALIITIIILLILAIVTIGAMKDSNIIGHAQNITKTYTDSQEMEKVQLAIQEAYLAGQGNIIEENLRNALTSQFGNNFSLEKSTNDFVITAPSGKKYIVSTNGSLTEYKEELDEIKKYDTSSGSWTESSEDEVEGDESGTIKVEIYKTNKKVQPIIPSDPNDEVFVEDNAYKLVITGIGENVEMPSLKDENGKFLAWVEGFNHYNYNHDKENGETLIKPEYKNATYMLLEYITEVEINNVINIGDYAFLSCHELVSCKIGEGVAEIGDAAFAGCEKLRTINFPNSLKKINQGAFNHCDLESVYLNCVEEIEASSFILCHNLQSVEFGNNTSKVGKNAFTECTNLKEIDMKNVQTLGERLFGYSSKIETIKIASDYIDIKSNTFYGVGSGTKIYVTNEEVKETIKNTCSNGDQLNIEVKTLEEMNNL